MAMKPERQKAFEAALDSLKDDELRALEGLTVVRMEHKDIEMIAHVMGEIHSHFDRRIISQGTDHARDPGPGLELVRDQVNTVSDFHAL